jgi:hypothetical protein
MGRLHVNKKFDARYRLRMSGQTQAMHLNGCGMLLFVFRNLCISQDIEVMCFLILINPAAVLAEPFLQKTAHD